MVPEPGEVPANANSVIFPLLPSLAVLLEVRDVIGPPACRSIFPPIVEPLLILIVDVLSADGGKDELGPLEVALAPAINVIAPPLALALLVLMSPAPGPVR